MSKAKITPVRIGQIEVGTTGNLMIGMWPVTEIAVTCQKTGFKKVVSTPENAMEVAAQYAKEIGGYVYRAALPTDYAQKLTHLPRS